MEIFNFRSCKQKSNQSLDDFVTELRKLSQTCEFANTEAEILSQVIQHCRSLREPDKSLTEILALGRSVELADQQAAAIEDETVTAIDHNKSWKPSDKHKFETQPRKDRNPLNNRQNFSNPVTLFVYSDSVNYWLKQSTKFSVITSLLQKETMDL